MTRYSFVGFPVTPQATVDIPDESVIVGANFTVQNQWQIMCLVPLPAQEPQAEEEKKEEGGPDADVPPEP